MEEEKKNEAVEAAAENPAEEKFVRVIVSEKVSIVFPEHGTRGEDILSAIAHLCGMYLTARQDEPYRKEAKRLLKGTLEYVTSGEWERGKTLRESSKVAKKKSDA